MNAEFEITLEGLSDRLREARESAGLSRAALGKRTGIPPKAIEKFEAGTQEPSVSRLMAICDALEIDMQALIDDDPFEAHVSPSRTRKSEPDKGKRSEQRSPNVDHAKAVLDTLARLDGLRADEFEGSQRQALAMIETLGAELKKLEPDELLDVAKRRGLYLENCPRAPEVLDMFREHVEAGQQFCGSVEERIIDTAVLGADLYSIEADALHELADRLSDDHDIESPGLFDGWGEHEEFVPIIRPVLRDLAVQGKGVEFDDAEVYARRL